MAEVVMSNTHTVFDYINSYSDLGSTGHEYLIALNTDFISVEIERCTNHGGFKYLHCIQNLYGGTTRKILVKMLSSIAYEFERGDSALLEVIFQKSTAKSGRLTCDILKVVEVSGFDLPVPELNYLEFYQGESLPYFGIPLELNDDEIVVFYKLDPPAISEEDPENNIIGVKCYYRPAAASDNS